MNMTTHTTSTSTRRSSLKDYHHDHYINHNHNNSNNNNNNSSFSSSLLEEIYRSFDESRDKTQYSCYTNNKMKKSNNSYDHGHDHDHDHSRKARTNRLAAVDQWVENERRIHDRRRINYSSSTSSSDSTSSLGTGGYPFTTYSDTEALSYSKQKPPPPQPITTGLRPIRTASDTAETHRKSYSDEIPSGKKKKSKDRESNLQKRALKLYGDLKKVRQPISPGGKLASFLNSLFTSNNGLKKPKMSSSNGYKMERESIAASTPSTTASRSCLSKTPSSAGRFEKRSVRFVDDVAVKRELSSALADDEEFKVQIMEKHRRVEEMAKELLKNYRYNYDSNSNSSETTTRKELRVNIVPGDDSHCVRKYENGNSKNYNANVVIEKNICKFVDEEDEDEDEDDGSCCSSDLFELENLMEIGVPDRYREELPVYETTRVSTNRAIANGYMLY